MAGLGQGHGITSSGDAQLYCGVRSLTLGVGSFHWQYDHLQEVPTSLPSASAQAAVVMVTEVHEPLHKLGILSSVPPVIAKLSPSSTSEENDQAVQERWGPFNNPKLWRRVGLIRSGSANRFRE